MIFGPGYILSKMLAMATFFIARDGDVLSNLRKEPRAKANRGASPELSLNSYRFS
jgi:hypothetical protein